MYPFIPAVSVNLPAAQQEEQKQKDLQQTRLQQQVSPALPASASVPVVPPVPSILAPSVSAPPVVAAASSVTVVPASLSSLSPSVSAPPVSIPLPVSALRGLLSDQITSSRLFVLTEDMNRFTYWFLSVSGDLPPPFFQLVEGYRRAQYESNGGAEKDGKRMGEKV